MIDYYSQARLQKLAFLIPMHNYNHLLVISSNEELFPVVYVFPSSFTNLLDQEIKVYITAHSSLFFLLLQGLPLGSMMTRSLRSIVTAYWSLSGGAEGYALLKVVPRDQNQIIEEESGTQYFIVDQEIVGQEVVLCAMKPGTDCPY